MGQSIYNQMNNENSNPIFNLFGGFQRFQQNFYNFANQVRHSGTSPEAAVRELINSGRMTQEQFNQFSSIANQIVGKR